ncbi:hypothetical protein Taro_010976 [Colocasia esculenta]|uniref:Uncharacterized protein n=1 Tax=Colocasia esculenta TaxID=4460 RepID=A0A843U528_COLES|nr:hypothetical protein [Colocasia esculenta]
MPNREEWVEMENVDLPYLRELIIKHLPHSGGAASITANPQCRGKDFFNGSGGIDGTPTSPYLERLQYDDMLNWEEWMHIENTDLPYLHQLIIKHCPMLKKLLTKLTKAYLLALANLVHIPPTVEDLELQGCNEALLAASLPHLNSLKIVDFPNLTMLPLYNLVLLCNLHVSTCPRLRTLDFFYFCSPLLEYIEGLQSLKTLGTFVSLRMPLTLLLYQRKATLYSSIYGHV